MVYVIFRKREALQEGEYDFRPKQASPYLDLHCLSDLPGSICKVITIFKGHQKCKTVLD